MVEPDAPGKCEHCKATILPGYTSCSDCTARLEFAKEQVRNRELAHDRLKAATVEERKQMIEHSRSLGRAAMERREREIELGSLIRDSKVDRRLEAMLRSEAAGWLKVTSSGTEKS